MIEALRSPGAPAFRHSALRWLWPPVLWGTALALTLVRITAEPHTGWPPLASQLEVVIPLAFAALIHRLATVATSRRQHLQQRDAELAAVMHDLRGPLLTTRSYLDLLAAEGATPLPAEAREIAGRAAIAAARAQVLVGSLTPAVSMPATARVELGPLIDDVLGALSHQLTAANATIQVHPLPAVTGDHNALYRVFANLIENAIKYGARDGLDPRIEVAATHEGSRCIISVRDWGIGIPAAERDRIFGAAYRGTRTSALPGQGLGLTTARQLLRAHHGDITVDPAVTEGARLQVTLPLA